jgi:histidine ammonia-lyase
MTTILMAISVLLVVFGTTMLVLHYLALRARLQELEWQMHLVRHRAEWDPGEIQTMDRLREVLRLPGLQVSKTKDRVQDAFDRMAAVLRAADRWVKVTETLPTGTYADDMRDDVIDALRRFSVSN